MKPFNLIFGAIIAAGAVYICYVGEPVSATAAAVYLAFDAISIAIRGDSK